MAKTDHDHGSRNLDAQWAEGNNQMIERRWIRSGEDGDHRKVGSKRVCGSIRLDQ
jgi:hypothetical protein